jgi:hypothetical protein
MIQEIAVGIGIILFSILLFPIYKYWISKAQMTGWLHGLKQNKEEGNVKKKK